MDILESIESQVKSEFGFGFENISEIRLRRTAGVGLRSLKGENCRLSKAMVDFDTALAEMMAHSLYAIEDELCQGYFHMKNGIRVGVAGNYKNGRIVSAEDITSVCVRIPHEVIGCADGVICDVAASTGTLIVSPPGMGKTTLLRDVVRQISDMGDPVALIDERAEISGTFGGRRLDVGKILT